MLYYILIFICNIRVSHGVDLFYPLGLRDEIGVVNIPAGSNPRYNVNDPHNLVIDILSNNNPNVYKVTTKSGYTSTVRYSSEDGYVIRKVVYGNKAVWECTTKFEVAKTVEAVRKKGMLQLVSVKNGQLESFFRREKCSFVTVETGQEYSKLKRSLDNESYFLDTWVEMDLSMSDPVSIFFSRDIYYEEGVATFKLMTLKPFKLFRVFDSETLLKVKAGNQKTETLWEYDENLMCEWVLVHNFQNGTLLKLLLSDGKIKVKEDFKFYKKMDGNWHPLEKNEFESEYKLLKSNVTSRDITLDLGVKTKDERFYRKHEKVGKNSRLSTLFPKTGYNLKRLFYDGQEVVSLSGEQRFSSVLIHCENNGIAFVNALAHDNDQEVKLLYFLKDEKGLVSVDKEKYESELSNLRLKGPEVDSLDLDYSDDNLDEDSLDESREVDDPRLESLVRVKFNVLYDIDENYFTKRITKEGEFELHTVLPKDKFIINLVDSHSGVVWKSVKHNIRVEWLVIYFKSRTPQGLKLLILGGKVSGNKYFVMSDKKWDSVPVDTFYKALNKNQA
ncbi:hypothetical protein TpMuguga_03g00149 [Theileria parva strain Muguga]|uniref:Signal peptide containing protein n=1 Tax=Theileria parva TaxID=5875 RepID=Q4N0I7_THEPA|nr:uncharacterized protein TpMuguga_03g00149 [Theileria parva strain Muguga]EAN30884.1 hypothetical protein TpMuguga_03g00149 [Theileria parva strain Muguga]|eukprot:XP_763167.1 hypothetical protein [Theileria parva strain Muguga]